MPGKQQVVTNAMAAVKRLQYLAKVSKLPSSFELFKVYRGLVLNFAKMVSSINMNLIKGESLEIDRIEKGMKAVNIPKKKLVTPPV